MAEEGVDNPTVMDPLFESDHDSSTSSHGSPEPDSEEAIFTLLFHECDADGSGFVEVESLVGFIRKTQLGQQHHSDKEEVYDSQDDVPGMQYNLHLLKAMLDCNAEDGKVDQTTYSHVIKKWVKDIRDRSNQTSLEGPGLEVSQLSDSPELEAVDEKDWSYGSYGNQITQSAESFSTSGGHSSHPELDRIELINSVADLKLENRRLHDRNNQLQIQMENSEENLKEIQGENIQLKDQVKLAQSNLNRLEQLEGDNTELATLVEEGRNQCQQLNEDIERLEQRVVELQQELTLVKAQTTTAESEYLQVTEENKALQAMLLQKGELLSTQEAVCTELETQLHGYKQQTEELSQNIAEVTATNEELKTENMELQVQLKKSSVKRSQPLSSTPYRPSAPSWHEELLGQENGRSPILPLREELEVHQTEEEVLESSHTSSSGDKSIKSESFTKILEETNLKINQKHSLIVRELSDLIAHSSPTNPSGSKRSTESSHMLISDKLNDKSFQSFESKLAEILRKKKQLQNENSRLSSRVDELTRRLESMERERNETGSSEATDSARHVAQVSTSQSATQTDEEEYHRESRAVRFLDFGSQTDLEDSQTRSSPQLALSLVAQHDVDGSECPPPPELATMRRQEGEEILHKQMFEDVMSPRASEEIDTLKRKQHNISQQYDQLQQRAQYIEADRQRRGVSSLAASSYRILKGVALLLLITVLVLFILSSLVILQDAFDSCGSYCPHSPVQFLFSNLEPYLQFTRTASPL